jgi:hypothetical protein
MRRKHLKKTKTYLWIFTLLPFLFPPPLTAADKRVALFPLAIYGDPSKDYLRQGLKSMFVSRLSGGEIVVIDEGEYESLLSDTEKQGLTSKERAEEIARHLKLDYALFGSITTIGEGYSLDLSILDLGKEKAEMTRISQAVGEDQLVLKLADLAHQFRDVIEGIYVPAPRVGLSSVSPDSKPAGGLFLKAENSVSGFQPTGKVSIRLGVLAFDMGDLNGDGSVEWVVLGRRKLLIYSREKGAIVLKGSLEPSSGESFLKVSVGDADEDGRAEIFLTNLYGSRVRTTVLEWTGKFQRLFRMAGNLRVLRDSDDQKPLLLFQESRIEQPFHGVISVMNYDKGGKLKPKEPLTHLKKVQFYTLTFLDLDRDGTREYLGLDENSHLHVWDQEGKSLWKSKKKLGGTNNAIGEGHGRREDGQRELPEFRVPLNSRPVAMDIDGDGQKEVLVIKNIPLLTDLLENYKQYTKATLNAYKVEGKSLVPTWTTREMDDSISDIQTAGRTLFLATQKAKQSNFSKGSGSILWFE